MREFGYGAIRVANPLKLRIRGPGNIEMSTGGISLLFNAGEIKEEKLFLLGSIVRTLAKVIERDVGELLSVA
jgi:hypothetical protein